LLDVLAQHPDFFVARRSQPVDVVLLVIGLITGPPLALWSVEQGVGLVAGAGARDLMHRSMCGGLIGGFAFLGSRGLAPLDETAALLIGGLSAVVAAALLGHSARLRDFGVWLAACAPLYGIYFLLLSPAAQLVRPPPVPLPQHSVQLPAVPIVMLILDELPLLSLLDAEERIDAERLPGFARLASTSSWFRNATTTADQTVLAVPSIMTGRRVRGRTPATFEQQPENLFTLLAPSHSIRAYESVTSLCPRALCREAVAPLGRRMRDLFGDVRLVALHVWLPTALTRDLPRIDDRWAAFGGDPDALDPNESFAFFGDGLRSGGARLDYLHVLSPHGPWEHLPTGQTYGSADALRHPEGLEGATWSDDAGFGQRALERHLLEVGNVDRLLGELIDALEARQLFDAALIVVVSDHGVSFTAGEPWRSVNAANFPELMPIPLFVKAPGQRAGVVIDRNVETIDVLPTMADVLGIDIPWAVDGHSALDTNAPERPTKRIENWRDQTSLETADFPAARRRALRARLATLEQIHRKGEGHPLVGTSIADTAAFTQPVELRLDDASAFASVDLDSNSLPLYVSGSVKLVLEDPNAPPPALAIAVDGRIRTFTTPHSPERSPPEREGRWRFSAVLPPESLHAGGNRIDVRVLSRGVPSARDATDSESP
jgi:hypothetical protein